MNASLFEWIRQSAVERVHFQGDSITQGCGFLAQQQSFVQFLADNLNRVSTHQVQIYNHAVGGATAVDGLNRIHWCERENHLPDLTFIMFGLNDVNQGIPIDTYASSLQAMIERLKKTGSKVVVLSPTPFPAHAEEVRLFSLRAGEVSRQAAVAFIDCLSPFYETGNVPPGFLWPDGVHLTAQGHEFLGNTLWHELERL